MSAKTMPRITEPDEGLVHFHGNPFSGSVTLCGLTDFIGHANPGVDTEEPVNCGACISIKRYCDSYAPHRDPKKITGWVTRVIQGLGKCHIIETGVPDFQILVRREYTLGWRSLRWTLRTMHRDDAGLHHAFANCSSLASAKTEAEARITDNYWVHAVSPEYRSKAEAGLLSNTNED